MIDIAIYESGDGGDLLISNKDLTETSSVIQSLYILLFGGNVEARTIGNEEKSQIRKDWWGNFLLKGNKMFNSLTEKTLTDTVLNSNGRLKILNSVKEDLKELSKYAKIDVDVILPKTDFVNIRIKIISNNSNNIYEINWDKTKKEPVINLVI